MSRGQDYKSELIKKSGNDVITIKEICYKLKTLELIKRKNLVLGLT